MNLVAFEFSVLPSSSQADYPAIGVNGFGKFESLTKGMPKQLPHHQNYILVGMIVIIPKHDMITRLAFSLFVLLLFWGGYDGWFCNQS